MKKVKAKKATDTEVKVEIKTAAEVKAFEECKELYEQSGASEFFNFTTYLPIMKWLGFTDFKITDDITDQKLINAYSSFANSKFETPSVEKYGLEKLADIVESRRLSEKDEVEQNLKILKSLDSQRSTRTNAIKNKDSKEGKEKLKRIENDTEYFRLSQRITGLQNKLTLCEIKETLSKRIEEIVEAEQRQEEIELQKHKKDSEDQLYVGGKKPFSDGSSQPTSKLDNKEQEQTPTKEPKTDQARLNTNSSDAFSEEKGVATQADSATQAQTSANEIHKEPDSKSTLEDFGRNANDPELRIESGDPDLSDDVVLKTQSPAKESEIQVEANKALLTLQSLEKHNKGQNSKYQRDDDAQSQDSRAEEVLEENKGGRPDYNLDLTSYMQDDIQGGESPLLKSKFPEGNYEAQVGANLPEHKTVKRGGNEDYGDANAANNQTPAGSPTPEQDVGSSNENEHENLEADSDQKNSSELRISRSNSESSIQEEAETSDHEDPHDVDSRVAKQKGGSSHPAASETEQYLTKTDLTSSSKLFLEENLAPGIPGGESTTESEDFFSLIAFTGDRRAANNEETIERYGNPSELLPTDGRRPVFEKESNPISSRSGGYCVNTREEDVPEEVDKGYEIIGIRIGDSQSTVRKNRFFVPLKELSDLLPKYSPKSGRIKIKEFVGTGDELKEISKDFEEIRNKCGFKVAEGSNAQKADSLRTSNFEIERNLKGLIDNAIVKAAKSSGLLALNTNVAAQKKFIEFAIEFARTNNGFGTRKNDVTSKIDLFSLAINGLEESDPAKELLQDYCAPEGNYDNLFKAMKKFSRDFQNNMKEDGFLTAREGERAKTDVGMRLKKLSESYVIDEEKIREVEEVIAAELSSGKRFPSPSPRPVLSGDISRRGGSMNGKGL